MENQRNSLCPYCASKNFADANFWDPPAQPGDCPSGNVSGFIGVRRFGDIRNSTDCPMCDLICAALQRRGDVLFPAHDASIYYSRVLYGKYPLQNTVTRAQSDARSAPDTPCLSIKRTYRLRVSTICQHKSLPEIDERFHQNRAYDYGEPTHEGDIMLLKEEGDAEALFHGRRLYKSLNIPLVKRWISTCSDGCRSEGDWQSQSAKASPARVIDIRRLMIEQTPPNCDYAALSYTWGPANIPQLQLTKDNEPQLTKPEGLKGVWREIPRTIRHAIRLCKWLGINYLWVDALCRGKGDGYEGEKEIKDIGLIFAKSCLTIVGNGRNSHRGLKGVGSPHSDNRQQISQLVGHLSLAVSQPFIDQAMKSSGWMKRLWTFEEWFISRRLLILANPQAFFCCKAKKMVYSEDTYSEAMSDSGPVISINNLPQIDDFWSCHEGWDGGFDVYAAHVEEYANRYVTNEDDWSSGLDMVKRKLQNRLGSQYHYNLPEKFFAQALCFAILSGRRRSSSKFPSWSWQGWDVSGQSRQAGYSGLSYESRWGFEPLDPPATYPYPAMIGELPDALKEHLVSFVAPTVELFAYKIHKDDGEWVVAVQDGGQASEKVGSAILNLADEQTNKGYFKFVYIGFCNPDREGESNEFLLVVTPTGYENVFCRVGCCLNLEAETFRARSKREMVFLI